MLAGERSSVILPRISTLNRDPERQELQKEETIKVLVVGGHRTGKSSLLRRFLLDVYTAHYMPTICVDVNQSTLTETHADQLGTSRAFVEFWDISHAELRGRHLGRFMANVHGIILVFDWTDLKSVQNVEAWRRAIDSKLRTPQASASSNPGRAPASQSAAKRLAKLPCFLLANKADVGKPSIPPADLDNYVRQSGFRGWRAVSARSGLAVRESFNIILDTVVEQIAYHRLEERCQRQLSAALSLRDSPLASPQISASQTISSSTMSSSSSVMDDDPGQPAMTAASASAALASAATSLRDAEARGTSFYLSLGGQLSTLLRLLPVARQEDARRLEQQRAAEYDAFRARIAEGDSASQQFASTPGDELSAYRRASAASKLVARHAALATASLADNMAKWQDLVRQLEMAVALSAPHNQSSAEPAAAPLPATNSSGNRALSSGLAAVTNSDLGGGRLRSGSLDSPLRPQRAHGHHHGKHHSSHHESHVNKQAIGQRGDGSSSEVKVDDALFGVLEKYNSSRTLYSTQTSDDSSNVGFGVRNATFNSTSAL